jgi:hypothetical protein
MGRYNRITYTTIFQLNSRTKTISNLVDKKSRTTISKYMEELIKAKILSPKKEGKKIYYVDDDLIRILEG